MAWSRRSRSRRDRPLLVPRLLSCVLMGRRGIAGVFTAAALAAALGATAFADPVAKQATTFPAAQNGRIVFSSTRDTGGNDIDVFIANADGSGAVNLTPGGTDVDSYHPSLSPDGTRILFARDPGATNTSDSHVYVMNVDGSNQIDLTPGDDAYGIADDHASFS